MTRSYKVYLPEANGGEPCEHDDGYMEVEECNMEPCVSLVHVFPPDRYHGVCKTAQYTQ